ncbi:MAG TPA: SsrA-binding protein SmpB [Gammaproteobacteria bacterium]|nr:SsrA-binding protein SmpB [Gammaproteobacteria bacterium]
MTQKPITQNKKAFHDYAITDRYEAGVVLQGWEVKSLREGRAQLVDAHAIVKNNEVWLLGMNITPLKTVSTHFEPDPTRTRKLLLHAKEISKLIGAVERKGYTLIPLAMYWKKGTVKLELGLAKGKKAHDKRETKKTQDWVREKARVIRAHTKKS